MNQGMEMDRAAIKALLLTAHQAVGANEVVAAFREMYPNTATASSQLSRFKRKLKDQTDNPPPTPTYLKELRLSPAEYNDLIREYAQSRDAKSRDARVLDQPDLIAEVAQLLLQSADFRDLWPACIVVSGLRPADLMSVVVAEPKTTHEHPDFWVSISNVAKKKVSGVASASFEHPLLAPRWLFVRALGIVRAYFQPPVRSVPLTKEELSMRYSSYWKYLLDAKFYFVGPDISHVLFRKFYAKYAYIFFKSDFLPAAITEHGFVSFALMHESNEPALAYGNLILGELSGYNIFTSGRALRACGDSESVVARPRVHVESEAE